MRGLLPLAACFTVCCSTCFIEEQSTTPMKAYDIRPNVESYRLCVLYCGFNAPCVSVSYSEVTRVCHLQEPATLLMCTVPPFRRFVKSTTNCVGEEFGVTYVRTDLSLEHGVDPKVPASLLHPNPVLDATGATPPCQKRRINNADGPVLYLRCLDANGHYASYGINANLKFAYDAGANSFMVDIGAPVNFHCISGFCAEENPSDSEGCLPLRNFMGVALSNAAPPAFNTAGACPGQRLHVTVYNGPSLYSGNQISFIGNIARIFCAGGFWLVGDDANGGVGQTFRIDSGSCGD